MGSDALTVLWHAALRVLSVKEFALVLCKIRDGDDEYKKWIQRENKFVKEYNSRAGEDVLLSERYIQPLIVMRHREKNERIEELCYKGESFQQLISSENNAEKRKTVLDALISADSKGICPDAVILQGNSGKGKSFTAQKIMLDWSSGCFSRENFDCVFHLKCKELNQISEEQSLVEILSINSNLTPDHILQILQKSSKRVLVLIDGFDELKFSLSDASKKSIPNNLSEKAPPDESLMALLRGCILPESFLLVMTRSTSTDTLGALLKKPQRFTEIIGFSEREVEEYFQKFFQDEELFRNAYESVKANETLFTTCSSPVICWIICTVIRERFNDGSDVTSGLETTTSIYVDFVFILLKHHCQGLRLSESVPTLLKGLGQLAERGMMERQKRTRQETMYSFMHLSFQEFFTALYYVLDEKEFCEVSDSLKEIHNICVPPSVRAQLKKWILHISPNRFTLQHLILPCLYELHEKDFVQKAIEVLPEMDMTLFPMNRTDCWALMYCLECCPHFKTLKLCFAPDELKMLQAVLHKAPQLELNVQKLADTDVSDLISALGEGKLLTEFRLTGEGLSDQSLLQVLNALGKQKTVGGLQIAVKNITADTVLILTDFIQNTEKWEGIRLHVVTWCLRPKKAPSLSQIILKYPYSEMAGMNLKNFLQAFHDINCSTEESAGFDLQMDSLLSHLSSWSGLSVIIISAPLLTEKWASRILFLIQSCSSLTSLRHRCELSDCCRHQNDQIELNCDQSVIIGISRENCAKEIRSSCRLIWHFRSYTGCNHTLHALGAQFVDAHWATLVQRVDKAVMPIADDLRSNGMMGWESYCIDPPTAVDPDAVAKSLDEYKKWIQREYEFVTEYNSLPGEHVLLSERYIQPLILMRHREKKERIEELCFKGEFFQQLISSKNNAEKGNTVLDSLFSADSKGICPSAVILQGNSGKGKSFTAQKIMLDWSSGCLSREDYDCVFHLKCKELNQISEEQSLVEILSINSNLTPDQILQILQKSLKRVLVLLDGFDELKYSFGDASNKLTASVYLYKKAPLEASLTALLRGCLLPESFLLVTTRSTATETLGALLKKPQRFTEIIGFSETEVEEYFQKFFQDEELFRNAYESVKANETLCTACSSPVICWIISTVIKQRLSDGADVTSGLETTTSIYVDFVSTLLENHCQGLNESVPTLLKSLGQLAEKGLMERQVLFEEKSVKKTVSDPSGSPFLGKFLFKKRTRQETMFSFMHLSFQEFFTALYYISLDEKEFLSKLTERFHSPWQSYGVQYLDENCPLKYGCPEFHFLPVIQFLCGLCNKEVIDLLKETYKVCVPPSVQAQLEEWILFISSNRDYNFLPFILLCLYELHEKDFVQKAVEAWQEMDMSWDTMNRTDCWALVYCLECCPHFRSLNLNFAAEELKMLQPVLCRTPELELTVQNLTDADVTDLISALGEGKLLGELRLNSSGLSDESMKQILHALHKQKTMGGLQIAVKNITYDTALILTDFLQDTEKWEEIRKAGFDQQVDSLLSHLSSVSGLNAINLSAPLLTEKWAFRILFLVQSCKSLDAEDPQTAALIRLSRSKNMTATRE
ncbi:NACHT, LRR and PYD domains-containing protein 3 [Triplophysa tibetana]|uniref:NACHT, LRR and PYD domains-containing protein 3 n=1 Tax=Triplophysa tibetana TaxID=1572043 RepID=A0A5A9P9S4_9TELE|nr:NACHT, LRR and PYD domains-containing protein 3 [Triplophysa tibetana]